jgi:hypothetical protein
MFCYCFCTRRRCKLCRMIGNDSDYTTMVGNMVRIISAAVIISVPRYYPAVDKLEYPKN